MATTDSELELLISYEERWKIVSELFASLPAMYDSLFHENIGCEYTETVGAVSLEIARRARLLAGNLGLQYDDAPELVHSLLLLLTLLYGPVYKLEELPISEDNAMLLCTRCPGLIETQKLKSSFTNLFHRCLGFVVYTVEGLNPAYTVKFVRASCMGDKQCEIKVMKAINDTKKRG